ncbi:MAG: ABC transporter permease [Anaerolineales bacterium]
MTALKKIPLWQNPILLKELKGRMRGKQSVVLIMIYLGLLIFFIAIVFAFLQADGFSFDSPDVLPDAGKALFFTVVGSELLLIALIAPALTSGAISSERERQTFDLLRVSLLSPRDLLRGKLFSALAYVFLLAFIAIPLQSIAFMLGGVGLTEFFISLVLMIVSAFLFSTLGLYFSAIAKRATPATVLSYAFTIIPTVLAFAFFYFLSQSSVDIFDGTPSQQRAWLIILVTLFSLNPISAGFLTALLLEEEHTALAMITFDPYLALPSAWIIYVAYSVALTVCMLRISEFYLRRYEY